MISNMNWRKAGSMPFNEFVIIRTKTGIIRVAKRLQYADGSTVIYYNGTYFKHVTHWMPIPPQPIGKTKE